MHLLIYFHHFNYSNDRFVVCVGISKLDKRKGEERENDNCVQRKRKEKANL